VRIICIEIVRWKRGLSAKDVNLLRDVASPLVGNVSYQWHLLFKGLGGRDRLATRYWAYQRPDGSRVYGKGASWVGRRKRDWSGLTKGVFVGNGLAEGFASYWTDGDICDKHVKAGIRRHPRDVLIRTSERWWGEADISLEDVKACKFTYPYEFGFEGQIKPEDYMIYYRGRPPQDLDS
jgi:hypothetical protein